MDLPPPVSGAMPINSTPGRAVDEASLKKAAEEFEAVFLSEMLKYTGVNATPEGYGGGVGEDAYSSLLTDEYARAIVQKGGIGVAEQVFEILKQRNPAE